MIAVFTIELLGVGLDYVSVKSLKYLMVFAIIMFLEILLCLCSSINKRGLGTDNKESDGIRIFAWFSDYTAGDPLSSSWSSHSNYLVEILLNTREKVIILNP